MYFYCWWLSMDYFFNVLGAITAVAFWQLYKQRYSAQSPGVCSKLEKEYEQWRWHHDSGPIQWTFNFLHAVQGLYPICSEAGIFVASPRYRSERASCENINTVVIFFKKTVRPYENI